ncbi:zwei Ig domain protein zig-8-like [Penaeus japonicus]|uniref:zwei Ig domain protein zig-8-like n=1 Tax=Penaeus japonicus TaxID=27405 RepID=UPI001C70FB1D|nr:zwei Ig domain protein zig-8-like [Penaeus japonicus]
MVLETTKFVSLLFLFLFCVFTSVFAEFKENALVPPTHREKTISNVSKSPSFLRPKVSWIRRRDLHVLTSGVHTFASDQRFIALHADRSENWTLHIRFSQARDSGIYQCQVNTDPRISMLFHLTVTEAATLMDGSNQRYVRAGSDIQLSCRTSVASQPPGLLYWYRDAEILNSGGRVDIMTELENETKSKLVIKGARVSDSGNYTCWPTKFLPASVMVHVIPEAKAAAKSQGGGTGGNAAAAGTTTVSPVTASSGVGDSPSIHLPLLLALAVLLFPLAVPAPLARRPPAR